MFNKGKGSGPKPPKLRLGRPDDDGVVITPESIHLAGPRFLNGSKQYGGQRIFAWEELADVGYSFRGTGVIGKAVASADVALSFAGDGGDHTGVPFRGYFQLTLKLRRGDTMMTEIPRRRSWNPDKAWAESFVAEMRDAIHHPAAREQLISARR